jgi:hypothetical protein
MDTDDLFYKLPWTSIIREEVLDFARTDTSPWIPYYTFVAKKIPDCMLAQDPFLKKLYAHRKFIAGVMKLEKNIGYQWHVDTNRDAGINMLLNYEAPSHLLFSRNQTNNEIMCNFDELKYEKDKYYLINSDIPHMVINFSEVRYLFSLTFIQLKGDLPYNKLLGELNGL